MRRVILKLWDDDRGALIAVEWLFIATILVLGVIAGFVGVRNFVNSGLQEFSNAVGALNQSYSFAGQIGCCAFTAGSSALDTVHTANIICTPVIPTAIASPPCG
jgi:Flp pilus assembly pilin Flp